jgi:hypothetical protein
MTEQEVQRNELIRILRERKEAGRIVERDVATHALLLISNGWPAQEALDESQRALDEAETEGGY